MQASTCAGSAKQIAMRPLSYESTGRTYPTSATYLVLTGAVSNLSTSSVAATHASHSATQDSEQATTTTDIFGRISPQPFAYYDRQSHCWRMYQGTFPWGSDQYSQTWPPAGTTRNGIAYQLPSSARRISDSACSSWPTPVAHDTNRSVPAYLAAMQKWGTKKIGSLQVLVSAIDQASVAYTDRTRQQNDRLLPARGRSDLDASSRPATAMAYADSTPIVGQRWRIEPATDSETKRDVHTWTTEPDVGRMADGFPPEWTVLDV